MFFPPGRDSPGDSILWETGDGPDLSNPGGLRRASGVCCSDFGGEATEEFARRCWPKNRRLFAGLPELGLPELGLLSELCTLKNRIEPGKCI